MQKYRYKTIKEIYDENISKINNGETNSKFDELIGISARYAVDFSDIARNAGTSRVRLDFTFDTETNIDKAVLPVHFYNRAHGMSEEDCIEDLHKKIASYELFALTNYMNDAGAEAEVEGTGATSEEGAAAEAEVEGVAAPAGETVVAEAEASAAEEASEPTAEGPARRLDLTFETISGITAASSASCPSRALPLKEILPSETSDAAFMASHSWSILKRLGPVFRK